jgi:D-alanine transaminase/branched-chain amino acid aminotransferase
MEKWVYLNNEFVLEKQAVLHVNDLALQRGYGLFDYLKTLNYIPIFIDDHLERFYFSARQLRLPVPLNKEQLKQVIHELINRNGIANSGIKLTLTGGYSVDGYSIAQPNLIIAQHPLQLPKQESIDKGIKLITYQHQRQLSQVKTIDYLMAIWLQPLIKEKGADDVLYFSNDVVCECPRANFFMITKEDKLVTPAQNILKGITRKNILDNAGFLGIKIEERDINIEELKTAKAAFICSTTKAILPVTQIDDIVYDDNSKDLIQSLNNRLAILIANYSKKIAEAV